MVKSPNPGPVSISYQRMAKLSSERAEALLDEMRAVMLQTACPEDMTPASWAYRHFESRRRSMRANSDVYLFHSEDGKLVGFLVHEITRLRGRPCIELQAGYVTPDYQGRGLAFAVNVRMLLRGIARAPMSGVYVMGVVGSAIAVRGWRDRIATDAHFYPRLPGADVPSPSLVEAAKDFAASAYSDRVFDEGCGRLHGVTSPRYTRFAECGDESVDAWFVKNVNPLEGDAVVMLIDVSVGLLISHITKLVRAVPRSLGVRLRPRRHNTVSRSR